MPLNINQLKYSTKNYFQAFYMNKSDASSTSTRTTNLRFRILAKINDIN